MFGAVQELRFAMLVTVGAFTAIVVLVVVGRARRRLAQRRNSLETPHPAIDLADLHAMLNAGTITPQEFERLKAVVSRRFATRHVPNAPLERARGFDVLPPVKDLD